MTLPSRTVAAIDRLIGACIDVPAAKMEAWANRIRNQGRLESTTYDAAVERVGAAIGSNADALRLVDEVAVSQIQAIANKKHVVNRAVEYLSSPSSDTPPEPESDVAELDEEVGLIQHVAPVGGMVRKIEPGSNELTGIFEGDLCLQIQTARPVEVKVIPITRIGQEISRILPPVDPMVVLRRLGEALRNRDEIKSMSICRVVSRDQDGGARISAPLHEAPHRLHFVE